MLAFLSQLYILLWSRGRSFLNGLPFGAWGIRISFGPDTSHLVVLVTPFPPPLGPEFSSTVISDLPYCREAMAAVPYAGGTLEVKGPSLFLLYNRQSLRFK